MRILAAVLTFVLLASPLYAQNAGGLGGGRGGGKGRASQNSGQQKADQLDTYDKTIRRMKKPGSAGRPVSSILSLKH